MDTLIDNVPATPVDVTSAEAEQEFHPCVCGCGKGCEGDQPAANGDCSTAEPTSQLQM